jgi:hypothetical protein
MTDIEWGWNTGSTYIVIGSQKAAEDFLAGFDAQGDWGARMAYRTVAGDWVPGSPLALAIPVVRGVTANREAELIGVAMSVSQAFANDTESKWADGSRMVLPERLGAMYGAQSVADALAAHCGLPVEAEQPEPFVDPEPWLYANGKRTAHPLPQTNYAKAPRTRAQFEAEQKGGE